MRKLIRLASQRVVIVSLAILLQIAFVLVTVFWLNEYRSWFAAAVTVLSWLAVLHILTRPSNPSYKIAWVVLVLAVPVAGLTIYLLFGGNRSSRRENRKMRQTRDLVEASLHRQPPLPEDLSRRQDAAWNHMRFLFNASGYPAYDNSSAVYYPSGEEAFASMLEELRRAERYIFLEFFILDSGLMWDSVLEILTQKAAEGVDVRVLYDDFGCIRRLPMRYARMLAERGIRAHAFNPYLPVLSKRLNNRDHRKLMIIDGRAGFTGGVNLADEYINRTHPFGRWKDCAVLVRGEAVWSMTVMFLSLWDYVDGCNEPPECFRPDYAKTVLSPDGYIQPFADSPLDDVDVGAATFRNLISSARRSVYIMTPYLILDDKMTDCLCNAAKTGVDVRIITPGVPDKRYVHALTRANYEVLTGSGVRIFEYTPGFVHAKTCLADGCFAVVGTVNLDFRSLYLHFEDAVYFCDGSVPVQLGMDFEKTFSLCEEKTFADCRNVHLYQKIARMFLRLFAPLM